jgi:hypothetical protein
MQNLNFKVTSRNTRKEGRTYCKVLEFEAEFLRDVEHMLLR